MRLRHLIVFALVLFLAVFCAAKAHAFDKAGTVAANATEAAQTVDLSEFYARGEFPTQITLYSAKTGEAPTANYVNATVYGQPKGSTGWVGPLYLMPADGASAVAVISSMANATAPDSALLGHISGEDWMFYKLKIVPSVDSSYYNLETGTIGYIVHGR